MKGSHTFEEALYSEPGIGWIPPTKRQLDRAFFILDSDKKLPDHVKPVTKYIVENPTGAVNGIYAALSKELQQGDIQNALDWLKYHKFVEISGNRYLTEPHDLQLLKEFLSRG